MVNLGNLITDTSNALIVADDILITNLNNEIAARISADDLLASADDFNN